MDKGLYIHLPFCKTKCHYCNFVSIADPAPGLRRRFFRALFEEIAEASRRYGRLAFDTLYLGGGTPSVLSVSEMTELMEKIREYFEIPSGSEITCEWNPGDGDDEKLGLFNVLGVNRISLGVQSFQDPLLKTLGRRHTAHDAILTIDKIRRAGISNISFDLMLRLPGQTTADFTDSLDRSVELGASQVSLYDLEVHDETVFGQLLRNNKLFLPHEDEHAAMYQTAIDRLTKAGYEHYEISNFAKPGFASRHNLIYWHNQEYLGLGPGAFSYLNGIRYQFAPDTERYLQKCEAKDWKNDAEDRLSDSEKESESFVTGLRLMDGVVPERFVHIYPEVKGRIEDLLKEGLLERAGGPGIRLSPRGQFLSEEVFGFLLQKEKVA